MTKKSTQKFEYLENEKRFWDEKTSIFIIFEGLSLKQRKNLFDRQESDFNVCFNDVQVNI